MYPQTLYDGTSYVLPLSLHGNAMIVPRAGIVTGFFIHYAFAERPVLPAGDSMTLTMRLLYAPPGSLVFTLIPGTYTRVDIQDSNLWMTEFNYFQSSSLTANVQAGGKLLVVADLAWTPGVYGTHPMSFTGGISVA